MYDFANILFSGKCNAHCYFCIGNKLNPLLNQPNLDIFPPRNLYKFVRRIQEYNVKQVVLTGTNTDPQLYKYEWNIIDFLRRNLPENVQLVLHTNGCQALKKMELINAYNRVTFSIPSFDPNTYRKMMGVPGPPDIKQILVFAQIPIKLSLLLDENNSLELSSYLDNCASLGIRRVVLRKKYGEMCNWESLIDFSALKLTPIEDYKGNLVYEYRGVEVTLWDFNKTLSRSINLFSNGMISDQYLLVKANLKNQKNCSFLKRNAITVNS